MSLRTVLITGPGEMPVSSSSTPGPRPWSLFWSTCRSRSSIEEMVPDHRPTKGGVSDPVTGLFTDGSRRDDKGR